MNIYKIYTKNKRENKKNKEMALIQTMQELSELINKANINKGFVGVYKFYKQVAFMGSTLLPNICLGLGTGVIMLCVGLFVDNIRNLWLQTLSNAVLISVGFYLLIFFYMVASLHTYLNILVPYVVELMEKKINEFNAKCISDKKKHKYAIKIKRRKMKKWRIVLKT